MLVRPEPDWLYPQHHRANLNRRVRHGRHLYERYCRRIAEAHAAGERVFTRALLSSYDFKVHAAYRLNRRLPRSKRYPPLQLLWAARQLQWNAPLQRSERLIATRKKSGGIRPLWDFGLTRRIAMEGMRLLLAPYVHLQPFQFDFRGVAPAIRAVKAAVSRGNVFARHIDIRNHFASFDDAKLAHELPFGRRMVGHWVVGRGLPVRRVLRKDAFPQVEDAEIITLARRGIPQGSALSSLIAPHIGSKLSWNLETILLNYADNYLLLGRSQDEVDVAADILVAAIGSLPGGYFRVHDDRTVNLAEAEFFLGHCIWLSKGALHIEPTDTNEGEFWNHIEDIEARMACAGGEALIELCGRMWVYARSFSAAFAECGSIDTFLKIVAIKLEPWMAKAGVDHTFLESYSNPEAEWAWYGYMD